MTHHDPAQKKPPRPLARDLEGVSHCDPDARASIPEWSPRGQRPLDPAATHEPAITSTEAVPAPTTDQQAVQVWFDKQGLAKFLGISTRSLDRINAKGRLPAPDFLLGRSARWSPWTVRKWLQSRPRIPGRGGRHGE